MKTDNKKRIKLIIVTITTTLIVILALLNELYFISLITITTILAIIHYALEVIKYNIEREENS